MPIFKFIAVTGTALLALLFAADAMLTPSGPLFTNDSEGLTRAEPKQQQAKRPEPVQTQETPWPRAPSLLQVDSGKAEPAQDETVRFELPQLVIAAPAQAPTQVPAPAAVAVPAPVAALVPTPAPAPLPATIEATSSASQTPVDPAASGAMAAADGKADTPKLAGPKAGPAKTEAARIKAAKLEAVKEAIKEGSKAKPARTEPAEPEAIKPATPKIESNNTESNPDWTPATASAPPLAAARTLTAVIPAAALTTIKPAPQVATGAREVGAARTEAAPIKTAKADPAATEAAKTEMARPQAAKPAATRTQTAAMDPITVQAPRAAHAPKPRKPVARQHESRSRHTAYRDGHYARDREPRTENGYAYGVSPAEARAERLKMQRRWSGGDFGPNRDRF